MKKIKLIIPFINTLFTNPSAIFKALYHVVVANDSKKMVAGKFNMTAGLREVDLLHLFPGFKTEVSVFTNLYGASLPIDMAILKLLAQRFSNGDYLEFGTWRGESMANIAPFTRSAVSISLSNEDMGKLGWGKEFQQMQRLFSGDLKNVKHIEANSMHFDFASLHQKFDLIFIDGDHSYEGVKSDTKNSFQLLKNENSIIVWHDYTSNYEHINWEVFAGILDGAPEEKRKNIYHISNSLCAIYLNQPIESRPFKYPYFPDKNFKMTIEAAEFRKSEA
ncbi:MAG: class I SAM-dependent methyltransferase [Chitinophagaceae bacterium]|nr:class I SAM-dependent methyltransferase [Chitinophagaceae bacterium]